MAKPLKLLLVEDNPGDRCLLEALLYETHPGCFELLCAGSLAEGLELARSPGLAIVLLDLGLPDSQGTDTLRRMRAGAPGLPIVVFTGHDDDRLAADALREGAQDYLVKGTGDGALIARSIRYSIERKRGDDMLHRAYD
jgi:sigma-B regulation protein RsbU (phosphoserine phosphatase)